MADRAGTVGSRTVKRGRGRPRIFDRTHVVEQAMRLFWDRGYEGASFNALIKAMGMSASSLQNAFGSKECLFREAVQHYNEVVSTWYLETLAAQGTARAAFAALFERSAAALTRSDVPVGCMVSISAMQTDPDHADVRALATQARKTSQKSLADRVRRGIAEGDVPADTDADALAAYFGAVLRGMAVQARDGATRAELVEIGTYALRAWPAAAASECSGQPAKLRRRRSA